MHDRGVMTYYVDVEVMGLGRIPFLVDTGAGYLAIGQQMFRVLERHGQTHYLREMEGMLADGTRITVPVYRIAYINIGGNCVVRDVETTVFPHATRAVLGLSALRKTAPFKFSINPPTLELTNCQALTSIEQTTDLNANNWPSQRLE